MTQVAKNRQLKEKERQELLLEQIQREEEAENGR